MSLIKREQAYLQEWISILEVGIMGIMRKYGISPQDFKERKVIRSISEIASHLRKKLHDTTFEKRGGFLLRHPTFLYLFHLAVTVTVSSCVLLGNSFAPRRPSLHYQLLFLLKMASFPMEFITLCPYFLPCRQRV